MWGHEATCCYCLGTHLFSMVSSQSFIKSGSQLFEAHKLHLLCYGCLLLGDLSLPSRLRNTSACFRIPFAWNIILQPFISVCSQQGGFFSKPYFVCVMCAWGGVSAGAHVQVRGQLSGVSFLHHGFQGLKLRSSGSQGDALTPPPTPTPSHPLVRFLSFKFPYTVEH